MVTPGKEYPIENEEWLQRVSNAKAAKSKVSKGASPEEVGKRGTWGGVQGCRGAGGGCLLIGGGASSRVLFYRERSFANLL